MPYNLRGEPSVETQARVILHLEDDDATARLFQLAVSELNTEAHLFRVVDAKDALAFLQRRGKYINAPTPDVAVLDVNLPGLSGFDVLRAIRLSPILARLPVIVLSSSAGPDDRAQARDLGAAEYVLKSPDLAGFYSVARMALGAPQQM